MFNKLLLVAGLSLVLISRLGESRISARRHHRAEHGEEAELTSDGGNHGHSNERPEPPAELDWSKDTNRVNPVARPTSLDARIQATIGLIEGQQVARNFSDQLAPLSGQQILDCCDLDDILNCLTELDGIESEVDYPATGVKGRCKFNRDHSMMGIRGDCRFKHDELALKYKVAFYGPLRVNIRFTDELRSYKGGIYSNSECKDSADERYMLLVGYGSEQDSTGKSVDYWKLKNFQGESWGEEGFLRLERGSNMCAIVQSVRFTQTRAQYSNFC